MNTTEDIDITKELDLFFDSVKKEDLQKLNLDFGKFEDVKNFMKDFMSESNNKEDINLILDNVLKQFNGDCLKAADFLEEQMKQKKKKRKNGKKRQKEKRKAEEKRKEQSHQCIVIGRFEDTKCCKCKVTKSYPSFTAEELMKPDVSTMVCAKCLFE